MSATIARSAWSLMIASLFMAACVTINVYFPAAAVEKAADRIIEDIWGAPEPNSGAVAPGLNKPIAQSSHWLDLFIRPASAQADITVSTPLIDKLKQAMAARFGQLKPLFDKGAVGLTRDGLTTLRDPKAVGLEQRAQAQTLVKQENNDRTALYRAIAEANDHPEWESDIRATFAKQWIKKARGGWWYQNNKGQWQQR